MNGNRDGLEYVWPPHPPEDMRDDGRVVFLVCVDPTCQQCPEFAYHWHAVDDGEVPE